MKKSFLFLLLLLPAWLAAQNITGRITANGRGLKGVAVSDGDVVVVTDGDGRYEMQSQKRNGYVFYTLPRGYMPELADGFNPQFWQRLQSPSVGTKEVHDFRLTKCKNDNFRLIIGADTHLANRIQDLEQFRKGFIPCLQKETDAAQGEPVYSMLLGDLTWDIYWTQNKFNLHDFIRTCKEMNYSVPLFPVIGNHDNDPSVPSSPETDFLSSGPWRDIISPNYYSYNLGRVHIVVLDDIVYKNEDTGAKYAKGVVGSRNYDGRITDEQFDWLVQDLALVSKKTPIIVALHIPTMRLDPTTYATTLKLDNQTTERLCEALRDFKTVHIVSGHTHYNYCTHPDAYPNIMEHNIAAVCATWWGTGRFTGRHLCTDGTPGGYSLWTVKGRKLTWQYHSMEPNGDMQMRVTDMNAVRYFYRNSEPMKAFLKKYPARTDFSKLPKDMIYVNVFAYDDDWKVEVFEDGQPLKVNRETVEDPLHTLAFDYAVFMKKGSVGNGSQTRKNTHMFTAQAASSLTPIKVRVTDSFGQVYEQELKRPAQFDLEMW